MSEKASREKKQRSKPIPVRRSSSERAVIKRLAKSAKVSEARLMVAAALMLAEFKSEDELRAAVQIGGLLWQARTQAIMQVRRVGHQLEQLREEIDPERGGPYPVRLDEVLAEVAAALKRLGATWRAG